MQLNAPYLPDGMFCQIDASIKYVMPDHVLEITHIVQRLFWDGIEAVDVILDLALIVLPTIMVFKLQTSWAKKSAVITAFAARIMYGVFVNPYSSVKL